MATSTESISLRIARERVGKLSLQERFLRAWTTLEGWSERRRQRRALLALDDHLLRDIGVSRADAEHEGHKPFWVR